MTTDCVFILIFNSALINGIWLIFSLLIARKYSQKNKRLKQQLDEEADRGKFNRNMSNRLVKNLLAENFKLKRLR